MGNLFKKIVYKSGAPSDVIIDNFRTTRKFRYHVIQT